MKANERQTVNDLITERIMAMLEQGAAPWQKPWRVAAEMPRNLVSGKAYRGVNVFLLHAMQYASPYWLTFKQAQGRQPQRRRLWRQCPTDRPSNTVSGPVATVRPPTR